MIEQYVSPAVIDTIIPTKTRIKMPFICCFLLVISVT